MKHFTALFLALALTAPVLADEASSEVDSPALRSRVDIVGGLINRFDIERSANYVDRISGKKYFPTRRVAWYRLNEKFALGLAASRGQDDVGYGVSARIYFGK